MCGIAGFAGCDEGFAPSRLIAMRDALKHRGPDDAGAMSWRRDGSPAADGEPSWTGLAHRRLSIIDLSAAGHQPMSNEDGKLWITYNGEFYNFGEFRAELERAGHRFTSHCDTETILHLFEDRGIEKTLAAMNGMFAFALWDASYRRLVLARDRVGKKPLYYIHRSDGSFFFASEIKAFDAAGLFDRQRVDAEGLDEAITFGSEFGAKTVFAEVRQLPAGHFAVWENGRLNVTRYFEPPFGMEEPDASRTLDDLADELQELLVDAIRMRLVSDVPVGLFLSGGIDSGLIAALTAKVLKRDLRAFTISFPQGEYDESKYAAEIARELGLSLTVTPVRADDAALFEFVAGHFDQPLGDASCVPTHLVSKSARADVTVALTGDGGDELFAGYDGYFRWLRLWGDDASGRNAGLSLREKLWAARLRSRGFERGFLSLQSQFSLRQKMKLYDGGLHALRVHSATMRNRQRLFEPVRRRDLISRLQHIDSQSIMIDVILRKVDMMSMACALECRSPLLDHRVLSFAARLPVEAKLDASGRGKAILRKLLFRHVPERLYDRPKQGFNMPWEHVCTGDYARQLRTRWAALRVPHLRAGSSAWMFPDAGGSTFRMWQGLAIIKTWERRVDAPDVRR